MITVDVGLQGDVSKRHQTIWCAKWWL